MVKEDISVMFCPQCSWKLINADDDEKTNRCPKCKSWTWEVSQEYHRDSNWKEVDREFYLTDNDENSFAARDAKEAKKLIEKAFKIFEKAKVSGSQKTGDKEK